MAANPSDFRTKGHCPVLAIIVFFVPAVRVISSWLYNKTNGCVPTVMIAHYASNLLTGSMMLQAFTGSSRETYCTLCVVFACSAAFVILLKDRLSLGRMPETAKPSKEAPISERMHLARLDKS